MDTSLFNRAQKNVCEGLSTQRIDQLTWVPPIISLIISLVIIDELHKLEVKRCEAADTNESASQLSPRRGSLAVERHAHLTQLYVMLDLGYELPGLDELLLWASRNPNPHRERLRRDVESGEFAFERH